MYATPVLPSATTSNVRASLLHVLQVVLCMLPGDISACVMSYIVRRLLCVAPSRGQSPLCALFSWTGSLLPPPPTGLTGKRFVWGTSWRVCDLNACLRLMRPTWNRTPPTRCVPAVILHYPQADRSVTGTRTLQSPGARGVHLYATLNRPPRGTSPAGS